MQLFLVSYYKILLHSYYMTWRHRERKRRREWKRRLGRRRLGQEGSEDESLLPETKLLFVRPQCRQHMIRYFVVKPVRERVGSQEACAVSSSSTTITTTTTTSSSSSSSSSAPGTLHVGCRLDI